MKKWMPWAALAAFIVIAIGIYFISVNTTTTTPDYPIDGVIEPVVEAPEMAPDAREITFSQVIEVREKNINIDRAGLKGVPCSKERTKPLAFGYILLNKKNTAKEDTAQLACIDDYLRGITLHYLNKDGELKSINLGMVDGDAGDEWDSRSWITRDEDSGDLVIMNVSLVSADDIDSSNPTECTVTKTLYAWDSEEKFFSETETNQDFDLRTFTPPIGVSKNCLDSDGFWKGST